MTVKEIKRRANLTFFERIRENLMLLKCYIIARFDVHILMLLIQVVYILGIFVYNVYHSIFDHVYYADTGSGPRQRQPESWNDFVRRYKGTPLTPELHSHLSKEYLQPYIGQTRSQCHALFEAERAKFDVLLKNHVLFSQFSDVARQHLKHLMLAMSYSKEYMVDPFYHAKGMTHMVLPWVEFYRLFKTDFFVFIDKMDDALDLGSFVVFRSYLLSSLEASSECNMLYAQGVKEDYSFDRYFHHNPCTLRVVFAIDRFFAAIDYPVIDPWGIMEIVQDYMRKYLSKEEIDDVSYQLSQTMNACHGSELKKLFQLKQAAAAKAAEAVGAVAKAAEIAKAGK